MEQRLKERLIGAAVLVALAVWLIPWVLDGRAPPPAEKGPVPLQLPAPQQKAPQRTQTIDLNAPNESSPVVAGNDTAAAAAGPPAAPESDAAASASATASPPTSRHAARASEPQPQRKPAAQPPAASSSGPQWMVQLGSFGEQENAQRLAERVSGIGFDAKISTHKSDGQLLYRVRVGPKATRNAAEATATALSAHGFVAQVVTDD